MSDLGKIRPAGASHRDSVLRVGLLPQRVGGDEEHAGLDLSGLGSPAEQESKPIWGPVADGTDGMRYARRTYKIQAADHQPCLDGQPVRSGDYVAEIEAGFDAMYRQLLAHREALLADDGPLATFAPCDVRVVFRRTRGYAMLLVESFHPLVLGDALERTSRTWSKAPWVVTRIPSGKDPSTLAGETPAARFQDFLDRLRRPEVAVPLLRRYPVLARQAVERTDTWVAASREFLARLADDFDAIRRRFFDGADPGPLAAIDGGVSDPHRGGRACGSRRGGKR